MAYKYYNDNQSVTCIPRQSRFFPGQGSSATTYHSGRPKDHIVNQQPSLFAKSSHVFSVGDAIELGKGRQHIIHGASSETSEENNEGRNQAEIVLSGGILASRFVEIRQVKELCRVYSGSGDTGVGKDKKRDQVERQTYTPIGAKVSKYFTAKDAAANPKYTG